MTVNLAFIGGAGWQFFTDDGVPLSGGKIYTYAAGTTTPLTTYTSRDALTANTNPIILDAAGRTPQQIWSTEGVLYKYVVKTSADVLIRTWDNIGGSVVASNLAQDLADTSDNTKGDALVGFRQSNSAGFLTNTTPRTVNGKFQELISVKDFGAIGDGVVNDTSAILNALSALTSGGALYFPSGTYKFLRGIGSLLSDTINADDILIYGDGASSVISGYNSAGATPDDVGNQFYNVFQATNRSNITIKNLSFEGYTTPIALYSCSNILIDGIYDNAQLANASGWMRDKSVYVNKCNDVRIVNSAFRNFQFGVYVSGDNTTLSSGVIVSSCSFEHTTAIGFYATLFPVGVYWFYSDNCVVTNCTFKNIYCSVDNGTTGTGMGFGVYEGDGRTTAGVISSNAFIFDPKGSKTAIGIYTSAMQQCTIIGNTFDIALGANIVNTILLDSKNQNTCYAITGNTIKNLNTAISGGGITISDGLGAGTSINAPQILISGNTISGTGNAIRQDFIGNAKVSIIGNNISGTKGASIQFAGSATVPIKHTTIANNTIINSGDQSIFFSQYVISPSIIGNTILDGNLTNKAGDLGAAILFTTFSYGCYVANNTIGNTPYGNGLFTYSITNASGANTQIFKNLFYNNSYLSVVLNFNRYYPDTAPTNGVFDLARNEFVENSIMYAAGRPGWYCVFIATPALTANASSASTTVTVSSTTDFLAGDLVLFCKTANPYAGDYALAAQWHIDTIASVTNGTQFVLTSGIPVADGTFTAGTAFVKIARFKAAAAIAA